MASELVSVIVPVHNGASLLGRTLESVRSQTYPDLEVVVVDDGSTDHTAAIAERYGATVLSQANAGVASARNAGVARSSGRLLAFIDHDDLWAPTKIAKQLEALDNTEDCGFVTCHLRYFFDGEVPSWFRGPTDGTPVPGFVPSTWLVRRETFERVGGFDSTYTHGSDTDWVTRAAELGIAPTILVECLVDYRVHGGNASRDVAVFRKDLTGLLRARVRRSREAAK